MEAAAKLPHPLPVPLPGLLRPQLGALLLRERLLTTEQLEQALAEKDVTGARLGEIAVANGWAAPGTIARLLAEQHGLDYVDLGSIELDYKVAALLPEHYARRYEALPIALLDDGTIFVAVADPTSVVASGILHIALGPGVRLAVASSADLHAALSRVHGVAQREQVTVAEPEAHEDDIQAVDPSTIAPATSLVNGLLGEAIELQASDVHFEPQPDEIVVRARVDGVMRRLAVVPRELRAPVTGRLKIMAELDIAERRAPQDGRASIHYGGRPMDLRVAVLPTTHGEQIVVRLMNRAAGRLGLAELGMTPPAESAFSRAIRQPHGAVIACGPTGSGKTTTLYAALDLLNDADRALMTIEDPVEWQTPGFNQIEVNPRSGLTFARGLRTILRSDPDVLLVGEIRDEETARIALQAALTGHLVLTSLHTHNAASSIARLADMGVEPSLLASAVNCIVAQRLARRLCKRCRQACPASAAEVAELGLDASYAGTTLYRPSGCKRCSGTGFAGRVALYEVMTISGAVRRLIGSGSTEEIFAAAVGEGMTTIRQDGMRLVLAGVSSLDEIHRVTGDRLT